MGAHSFHNVRDIAYSLNNEVLTVEDSSHQIRIRINNNFSNYNKIEGKDTPQFCRIFNGVLQRGKGGVVIRIPSEIEMNTNLDRRRLN